MTLYHSGGDDIPVDVAVPVQGAVPENEHVKVQEIPAFETAACTVHHGSFDHIGEAYQAVVGWIEANGYQIIGPSREVYLQFDQNKPEQSVTEIQFPVGKG
jgi:effector-binding domain-containing protein